jgi:peroxiredoxin
MSSDSKPQESPVFEKPKCDLVNLSFCEVLSEDNKKYKIGSFWQNKTAILIFLRHFACVACRTHAVNVWKNREKYEKAGSQIYFIGNGQPQYISAFKQDLGLDDAWIFTDPTLKSFHHAGFNRGFLTAYGPRALKNIAKMYIEGNRDGVWKPGKGDLWQVGGVLAIKATGQIVYHHISEVQGDFPPEPDINDTPWISRDKPKKKA